MLSQGLKELKNRGLPSREVVPSTRCRSFEPVERGLELLQFLQTLFPCGAKHLPALPPS